MLAFYRGMHCSMCRDHLGKLQSMHGAFSKRGVTPIAISTDDAEREWGLYVSRGFGISSLGIEEPPMFVEPALFLIRPDRTLYCASVQSMPFGRPCFEELLSGIEKAVARQYPARGELTDWDST